MPVYSLTPLDVEHPDWEISSHKERCLVHALDDRRARMGADAEFIQVDVLPGFDLRRSPWLNPERTSCEILTGTVPENYREGQIEMPSSGGIETAVIGGRPIGTGPIGGGEVGGWKIVKAGKSPPGGNYGAQTLPKIRSGEGGGVGSDAVHGVYEGGAEETIGFQESFEAVLTKGIARATVRKVVANREALIIQAKVFSNFVDQQFTPAAYPSNTPPAPLWTEDAEDPEALNDLLRGVQDRLDRLIELLEGVEVDQKQLSPALSDLRKVIMAFLIPAAGVAGIGVGGMAVTMLAQYAVELGLMDWPKFVEVFKNLPRK